LLRFVQTNSLTLARQGDGLGYIRIWATPLRRLVFWDGALSSYTPMGCIFNKQNIGNPNMTFD